MILFYLVKQLMVMVQGMDISSCMKLVMKRSGITLLSRCVTAVIVFELIFFPHSFHAAASEGAGMRAVGAQEYCSEDGLRMCRIQDMRAVQALPQNGYIKARITRRVVITAYSSTVDQTDSDPFITASGRTVRDGIVAANFLPFGARLAIPDVFGEKVFYVDDRMNRRFSDRVDVWMETREEAVQFGVKIAMIEIY